MSAPAINVQGVSKEYVIGQRQEAYQTFREMIGSSLAAPFRRFSRLSGQVPTDERFWALKDVSFEINEGEIVGIIGRNGAGKSTLLKILSRITAPTQGKVELCGRVASLLEVGTGFHPELTGRENIYLNGAILGMSRTEIDRKFDAIVAFADVEKFLDTPVKRYSSGMYVRLAFAVAAHLEPEILLVDEVLAVGDAEFQKKCLGKISEVAGGGRTVLFVSHNLAAIEKLCRSCIGLEGGTVFRKGPTTDVLDEYMKRTRRIEGKVELFSITRRTGAGSVRFSHLELFDGQGTPVNCARVGQDLAIQLGIFGSDLSKKPASLSIVFSALYGPKLFICDTETAKESRFMIGSGDRVRCVIPRFPLSAGDYRMDLFLERDGITEDWIVGELQIRVEDGDYFGFGRNTALGREGRAVLVDHSWE